MTGKGIPLIIVIFFCLLSAVTFILFGVDKRRAVKHRWRISESSLILFSLFGGIGGLLGMLCFHHKTKKWKFRILVPLFAILDAVIILFFLWTSVYYHADDTASAAMQSDDIVAVMPTETGWLFDGPADENALIFYPGAKVEETAYAPMLHRLAAEGMDVYLVKMPLRFAFLGIHKAERIVDQAGYRQYFIGGHSLGGAMAAIYASEHETDFAGEILFAAYPTKETTLDTQIIYGSEDGVVNVDRIKAAPSLVSGRFEEYVIPGGNHAQFGDYGKQIGDGEASITAREQQEQTAKEILRFAEE